MSWWFTWEMLIGTLVMQEIEVSGNAKWVAQLSNISIKDYQSNNQKMFHETKKI